ncbi:MAG: RlmE family RNA methyltransferase [Aigarchaeota archaeon]|nr:RlmE family RNA methyltransferase [Candidatus Pelearchaeum maunauluense]
MSKERWLQERRQDYYWRKAKELGLPSRAAFKLKEIQRRWRVIRSGDYILDLGAAPGGMTAVASRIAGEQGLVVAVDRDEVKIGEVQNVVVIRKDVFSPNLTGLLMRETRGRLFDTIISDLSPRHSGDYELLAVQQLDLLQRVVEIAEDCLRRRGNLVVKAFEHPTLRSVEQWMHGSFWKFERFVPRASKKRSSEVFMIGLGFKPR